MLNNNKIAVLLTCHNRRDKTLTCLKSLYQCVVPKNHIFEVFLVDDGSTDGTSEQVVINFPEVTIIKGNGDLYWNRGMHLAWQTAANTKDFDYYLWLNDDTFLFKEALLIMLQKSFNKAIVCGATKSIENNKISYGGFKLKDYQLIIPDGSFQECDYCNGNFVLISRKVFHLVGNLDPVFHHAVGDFDYSLRAKKLGVNLYIVPTFIGTCESHSEIPKWRTPSVGVVNRFKSLYSPSSGCYPPQFFVSDRRHNGLLSAIFHYFTIHLRALLPQLWK